MEPEESDHEGQDVPSALVRRACDQCRLRKIRCDKRTPCSNCRSSSIVCRSTGRGQKPPEPRRRVLISNQYEKKIDLIEERLASIESTLQQLAKNTSQLQGSTGLNSRESHFAPSPQKSTPSQPSFATSNPAKPKGPLYLANPTIEQHDHSSGFEGSSSLTAHGAYASAFLESAVSKSSPQVLSSPKISAALSSLKQLVGIQTQRREADSQGSQLPTKNARLGVKRDIRDLEMPPLPLVLDILRKVQETPPAFFGGYVPFLSVKYFTEKCREVYFCIDDYSDAAFVVTNFCLYSALYEYGGMERDASSREEHRHCIEMCRDNLETALANLNILMPASHESIMALALGAMHALEISKPSVAWTLASTAMNLCQTLGYHRITSMEHDPISVQRQKQHLFWSVYTILNMMSLRLGRASSIQNYDISLPPLDESADVPYPWGPVCIWWTRSAIIQSEVYQYLYSPEALQKPESERVTHAHRLAAEMQSKVMEPFEKFMASDLKISEIDLMYLATDKVSRLAIMTLIYRAIPASTDPGSVATFIPECIETAREALEIHRQCVAALNETDDFMKISYMHWGILLSPFVPFIVIFCNIITKSNGDDLARLEEFIASLQPLSTFSQSVDRLHTLCSVLGTVARLYYEANTRTQTAADQDQDLIEVGQEFDVYLSALGLAPTNPMNPPNSGAFQMGNSQGYFQTDNPGMHVSSADISEQNGGGFSALDPSQVQGQDSGTAAQLGNWFWGNQYMMGLLEEDLSQFNPSLHLRRIQLNYSTARHIVDAITLASEGFDAGTVLALWFDQCGRAIRYSREPLEDASDIANVSDAMLNEYSCWTNAQIGQAHE
ncbi:transcriptional regulator family: Fungal Specific TF [Penicillium roqueforti]|nr:transcriptional regulator family: Fungal Specific TF [Penicillium roqueforti]KAI3262153.1 transcriptional regulator family: Fungal Specific TF [Penicillium roqueforti]KAI3280555.1 transcriptional regulator family: Fungal Specific TF [Penicillium roqueforti]